MSFKLTILGSGAAVPTLNRSVTSQYLNFNERRILIDCGEGTQMQLRKFRVKFQRLQFLLISHLHGDHYLGIFGLLASMNLTGRTSKLTIVSPPGLRELVELQFKTSKVYLAYEIEFITIESKTKELVFEDKVLKIFAFPMKHRVPTYGYSFEEQSKRPNVDKEMIKEYALTTLEIQQALRGENIEKDGEIISPNQVLLPPAKPLKFVHCSDSLYKEALVEWISDADLLYHEATFLEKEKDRAKATMHSTAADAAKIAQKSKAKKLLIGHFSARYKNTDKLLEEAQEIFPNVVCVEDGDEYLI